MNAMSKKLLVTALALVAVGLVTGARAQEAQAPEVRAGASLRVDVLVSRLQGERKTSSLPFTAFIAVPEGPAGRQLGSAPMGTQRIRMGVDVPIGTTSRTNTSNNTNTTTTTPEYRNVGTSIDCQIQHAKAPGHFTVFLSVQDSSIFDGSPEGRGSIRSADPLAFRTFSMNNTLTMRDGQTLEFGMATDKVSGEIVKVEAKLTVIK